ncbi:metallophosphoesterase [Paenibacillus sp. EPM92]|uniref:metallophosphoesterase n=1 Tax=Paenibacillus sp. EPM92 TaxID=1561195 RepID=UPI001916C3BF|nr:metallophosphoesterase [Paenibacillus sp. EPM92]
MRIGILSDLHVDKNNDDEFGTVQEALCSAASATNTDLLIVAGDISNNYVQTLNVLEEIEERAGIPCLFVPGNHDIWNLEHPELSSAYIYEELQRHERNLSKGAYAINDEWIVLGDTGWYDFSYGSERFEPEQFRAMTYGNRTWKDKLYVNWGSTPEQITDHFYDKLQKQLEACGGKKVILVTHVVNHDQFTVPMPHKDWDYFNAFLGSERYQELIRSYSRSVKYAVCGHVHYRKKISIGSTQFICNCLGDKKEWLHSKRAYEEVSKSYVTIDI